MIDINYSQLKKFIQAYEKSRILVLGDIMLDKYIWGDVSRISPEAPVPVVEVKKDTSVLGGAGNVYQNLKNLGASPLLAGVVGNDSEGQWIKEKAANSEGIFMDEERPTTIKTRIIAHQQQVVRVDYERKIPISSLAERTIFKYIQEEKYDGILISDYNKGTLTKSLVESVLSFAHDKSIPVFVDPKIENFFLFSPVTLISPNHIEAEEIVHFECQNNTQVEKAIEKILSQVSSRYIILKRGEQGMSVKERGKRTFHIPTIAREVYDVTGAGDTVIATASLSLLVGASILEAAILSNTAASIVVGKVGTATASIPELLESLQRIDIQPD